MQSENTFTVNESTNEKTAVPVNGGAARERADSQEETRKEGIGEKAERKEDAKEEAAGKSEIKEGKPGHRLNYDSFAAEIEAVQENEFPYGSAVMVSEEAPDLLKTLGIENLPVLYGQAHLVKAMMPYDDDLHQHGISKETMAGLEALINSPCFVFDTDTKGSTRSDSIAILTDAMAPGGPVLISVHLGGHGLYQGATIDAHYVTGVYGKRKDGVLAIALRAARDGRLLYVDKEKTTALFKSMGMWLPRGFRDLPDKSKIKESAAMANVREHRDEYNKRYRLGQYQIATHYSKGHKKTVGVVKQGDAEHGPKNTATRQALIDAGIITPAEDEHVSAADEKKPEGYEEAKQAIRDWGLGRETEEKSDADKEKTPKETQQEESKIVKPDFSSGKEVVSEEIAAAKEPPRRATIRSIKSGRTDKHKYKIMTKHTPRGRVTIER